jgi:hypothetical protein
VFPPELTGKLFQVTRINPDWLYLGDPSQLPAKIYAKMATEIL